MYQNINYTGKRSLNSWSLLRQDERGKKACSAGTRNGIAPAPGKRLRLEGTSLMTKTIRFGAATAALAAALSMSTVAHAQASDTATATAEVLQALTLASDGSDLDFGSMVVTGAGVVSLDADGNFDCTDADIVCSGTTSVAGFDVTGTASKNVTINLPSATVELRHTDYDATDPTLSGADYVIELDSFDSNSAYYNNTTDPLDPTIITSEWYELQLDASGDGSFDVGGAITFDGSEIAGVYSADFTVSVEYS